MAGQIARSQYQTNRQLTALSKDVIPGFVVIKLKRTGSPGKGAVEPNADGALHAFSKYGVISIVRAFPQRVPLNDAAVAAGKVDLSGIFYATIPTDLNPVEVAAQLATLSQAEYAEPKYVCHPCDVPNDSDYLSMQQIYFDRMHVAEGWTLQKGSRDVVIATVDGGTNWQHPDLAGNMWINPGEDINHDGVFTDADINGVDDDGSGKIDDVVGWNFGNGSCNPRGFLPSNADHGTGTASDFGAVTNNARGMAGSGWNCRVMPICASDAKVDKDITYGFEAIEYAARMGARVINCSWYRPGGALNLSRFEQDVITAATQQGTLIVAAAQNDGKDLDIEPRYPASYDHVFSVGATLNSSDEIAYFTNYGLNVSAYAPGMGIYVAKDDGSYGTDQGTSHASPLVAGLAGLLFARHPDWTPEMVAEQIRMTADPIDGNNPMYAGSLGHGRVNFYRALSEVHSGITVTQGHFQTPTGRMLFVAGDTVTLSATVKNVLPLSAENISFNVSANPELAALRSIRGPARLDSGASDSVCCDFRVRAVPGKRDVKVKLSWTANADEHDGRMFKITLYGGGGFWVRQKSPTTVNLYSVHAVNSRVVWACGHRLFTSASIAVLTTTDGGINWISVNGDLPSSFLPLCVFAVDSLHAWVGGSAGQIYATVNGGLTWSRQDYPSPQSGLLKAFWFFDEAIGYAWGEPDTYVYGQPGKPGRYVILQTTNGGATWAHLANVPYGVTGMVGVNAFCCTDRSHIWFGAPDSAVWRTTDAGNTWSCASVGASEIAALAMRDDSVGIISSASTMDDKPPFFARTTDGGATWQELPSVKPDKGWAVAIPSGSSDAWVAGGATVARSHDYGITWAEQPTESFSPSLIAISFCDASNGWMTTNAGDILRYQDCPTSVERRHDVAIPVGFLLEQNFPNPFNPSTTIQYALPNQMHVRLIIYNALGQKVATVINGSIGPGLHSVKFDGSCLASGVYFYRMQAGPFVNIKKLLVVR